MIHAVLEKNGRVITLPPASSLAEYADPRGILIKAVIRELHTPAVLYWTTNPPTEPIEDLTTTDQSPAFLVNLTRREYVDTEEFSILIKARVARRIKGKRHLEVLSPLPFLAAEVKHRAIGRWYRNTVIVTEKRPEGFRNITAPLTKNLPGILYVPKIEELNAPKKQEVQR